MNITYTQQVEAYPAIIPLLLLLEGLLLVGGLVTLVMFKRTAPGISWKGLALMVSVCLLAIAMVGISGMPGISRHDSSFGTGAHQERVIALVFAGLLPLWAIPFAVRLYLKWVGGNLTEGEKKPGAEGIQAWVRAAHLLPALVIALCAWKGYGWSFWGVPGLAVMALLAYPVLNLNSASTQSGAPKAESLSPERERVLKMLDDGKIKPEECAELLGALGQATHPRTPQTVPPSPHRKMVFVGLGLLLVGFFLPWFSINVGDEMARTIGTMNQMAPQGFNFPQGMMPKLNTGTTSVMGGDIPRGLGWCVLFLGIAAGLLPYVAVNVAAQTLKKIALTGLGLGTVILIYLLTDSIRFVSVGILLALAGYALEFVGTLKDRPADELAGVARHPIRA